MIKVQTIVDVIDNSGAKTARCIKIYGNNNPKTATLGSKILVSVVTHLPVEKQLTKFNLKKKVTKGSLHWAIVVKVKKEVRREQEVVWMDSNAVVLLKRNNTFLFTRIIGSVAKDLNDLNHTKLVLAAKLII